MALGDELAWVSACELALRIRRRELSPVEVVDAFIARIEARNPSLNAVVIEGFEDARKAARAAEQAVMAGAALGPLHGVPSAIKDLFDFKPGWRATFGGIRALKDFVSDQHCAFAERIEQAGAILLGKTNSPVMGFRGTCDNPLFGPTRNPFDLARNSGGSSGGSAAAVADGLLPFAEGTDGGGSIRIPASWCGVYGYKASFGRVPFFGGPNAFAGTVPFLFEGPITRTVEDAALALTRARRLGTRATPTAWTRRSTSSARRGAASRAGRSPTARTSTSSRSSAGSPRWSPARSRAFEQAGAVVEEVKVGIERPQQELCELWCRLITPGSNHAFELLKAAGIDLLRDHAADLPPQLIALARARRADVGARRAQGPGDALRGLPRHPGRAERLRPAGHADARLHRRRRTPTTATRVGPAEIEGEAVDPLIGWCLTYPINFTGHPAASIPAGLADGLPVGMQIVGRRYADADVLAASAVFERLRPWQQTYETCARRPL